MGEPVCRVAEMIAIGADGPAGSAAGASASSVALSRPLPDTVGEAAENKGAMAQGFPRDCSTMMNLKCLGRTTNSDLLSPG